MSTEKRVSPEAFPGQCDCTHVRTRERCLLLSGHDTQHDYPHNRKRVSEDVKEPTQDCSGCDGMGCPRAAAHPQPCRECCHECKGSGQVAMPNRDSEEAQTTLKNCRCCGLGQQAAQVLPCAPGKVHVFVHGAVAPGSASAPTPNGLAIDPKLDVQARVTEFADRAYKEDWTSSRYEIELVHMIEDIAYRAYRSGVHDGESARDVE